MPTDLTDPKARLLMGEAVRLLTQSDVTGVAIAEFVLGFAPILNQALATPATSTAATREDLKAAVKEALQEVVIPASDSHSRRGKKSPRKSVPVRLSDGKRTSLWLDTSLVERLSVNLGSASQMRQMLSELADSAPVEGTSKSAWVENELAKRLILLEATPASRAN